MQGEERFPFLIKLSRWFFTIGLIVLISSGGLGIASFIYTVLQNGITAGFSIALKTVKWILLSLLFLTLSGIIALLISIERNLSTLLSEISSSHERSLKPPEEEEGGTIFDEFGIEIPEVDKTNFK